MTDEGIRHRILQLEEAVADKRVEVDKGEAELRQVQEETPTKASVVVARLKKADAELHDFETELATLRAVA